MTEGLRPSQMLGKTGKRSKIKVQPEEREGYDRLLLFPVVLTGRDCRSGVQNTP